jgi:hypothetical protein
MPARNKYKCKREKERKENKAICFVLSIKRGWKLGFL